jgi:hypothetical protein
MLDDGSIPPHVVCECQWRPAVSVWLVNVCSDTVGQTIVATLPRADGVQRVLRAGSIDG